MVSLERGKVIGRAGTLASERAQRASALPGPARRVTARLGAPRVALPTRMSAQSSRSRKVQRELYDALIGSLFLLYGDGFLE